MNIRRLRCDQRGDSELTSQRSSPDGEVIDFPRDSLRALEQSHLAGSSSFPSDRSFLDKASVQPVDKDDWIDLKIAIPGLRVFPFRVWRDEKLANVVCLLRYRIYGPTTAEMSVSWQGSANPVVISLEATIGDLCLSDGDVVAIDCTKSSSAQ